jgi:hypothetical protein
MTWTTQIFLQRYIGHFPAPGEIVILTAAGNDGLLFQGRTSAIPDALPSDGTIHRGAGAAICSAHRRSAAAMEAQSDGYRVIPALVRLPPSARHDAQGYSLEGSAWYVVRSDDKRKARHIFSYPGALQAHLARACQIAFTIREGARTIGPMKRPIRPWASVSPSTPMKITTIGVREPCPITIGFNASSTSPTPGGYRSADACRHGVRRGLSVQLLSDCCRRKARSPSTSRSQLGRFYRSFKAR